MTALCATRPSEWWEVPDDGNRLALLLCSVCPALPCGTGREYGVVRSGVAWSVKGEPLDLCGCGRPVGYPGRAECYVCSPPKDTPLPTPRLSGGAERYADQIGALLAEGLTYRAIGIRIGSNAEAVRGVARRHGWRSRLAGRPQALSTGEETA